MRAKMDNWWMGVTVKCRDDEYLMSSTSDEQWFTICNSICRAARESVRSSIKRTIKEDIDVTITGLAAKVLERKEGNSDG
jgi:hypothetical protein